ncbi:Protein FAM50 like protein [Myotis davidii]|uniref:Protein FAM50 like protein n=1 Tax=Myotis davidii TaxID=225400 RepID=L5MJW5_MYODS|nr:Protein FAM50 like protein [Myotis davidii]
MGEEEEEEVSEELEEVALDEEELEREEIAAKKRKLGKNPDVDTSFLPDRDREEEENRLREDNALPTEPNESRQFQLLGVLFPSHQKALDSYTN